MLLFGFLALTAGSALGAPGAGGVTCAIAIAAACVVDAIGKTGVPKEPKA